jgi:hypothetical protein
MSPPAGCRRSVGFLEQRDPLRAGTQEDLPVVLAIRNHAEQLRVELLRAPHIADVQHDVVDAVRLDHVAPPSSGFLAPL